MEDTLRNLFFAYDLVQFVLGESLKAWEPAKDTLLMRGNNIDSNFDADIGESVVQLLISNKDSWRSSYEELKSICQNENQKFISLAISSVPVHFPNGYNHEVFLAYCAHICGAAYHLGREGNMYFGDFASETIALVLTAFTITRQFQDKGGFIELVKLSHKILRRLSQKMAENE